MRQFCATTYAAEAEEWAPIPHTAITALSISFGPLTAGQVPLDRVYYQGLNGCIYGIDLQHNKPWVPLPSVRGGILGTLAPMAVIDPTGAVGPGPRRPTNVSEAIALESSAEAAQLFYLDPNSVLNKGTVTHFTGPPGPVYVHQIDWLNVDANRASKLAALAVPLSIDTESHGGRWVYYQSGGEKMIKELWIRTTHTNAGPDPNYLDRQSQDLRFTTFSSEKILMGTSLAANVLRLEGQKNAIGSFYYQRQDGTIWRNLWLPGKGWNEAPVTQPGEAAFHTGLAVTYYVATQTEFLYYITVDGKICEVRIDVRLAAARVYKHRLLTPEHPPLPGTSLAATTAAFVTHCVVHLYYQDQKGHIQRLLTGCFKGQPGVAELHNI